VGNLYCIDTSSVIHLRNFPQGALGPLWELLDSLTQEQRLFAPREVLREVAKQEDVGHAWARAHRGIFVDADEEQGALVGRLQTDHPDLNVPTKPLHADPWCLALALLRTRADDACYVINEERDAKPKLPWLCARVGVRWARLLDIPGLEGLRFTLARE
jgi:hypothetical protein